MLRVQESRHPTRATSTRLHPSTHPIHPGGWQRNKGPSSILMGPSSGTKLGTKLPICFSPTHRLCRTYAEPMHSAQNTAERRRSILTRAHHHRFQNHLEPTVGPPHTKALDNEGGPLRASRGRRWRGGMPRPPLPLPPPRCGIPTHRLFYRFPALGDAFLDFPPAFPPVSRPPPPRPRPAWTDGRRIMLHRAIARRHTRVGG